MDVQTIDTEQAPDAVAAITKYPLENLPTLIYTPYTHTASSSSIRGFTPLEEGLDAPA